MADIIGALLSRENGPAPVRESHEKRKRPELLLRELNHRWSNDMQLILALLSSAARDAETPDAREALKRVAGKIDIIVANRAHLKSAGDADLELALCRAAKTIDALCDRIEVKLEIDERIPPMDPDLVLVIVLAVNEIATNAIKHAFGSGRAAGAILITASVSDGSLIIAVEDDGSSWAVNESAHTVRPDGGLELVRRMVAAHGGLFLPPGGDCKRFEFRFQL